jgi:hypothetical protein
LYSPSWIDRFRAAVGRLPVPYWFVYLLLFIGELLVIHAVAWITGTVQYPGFDAALISFPIWLWGSLAVMTYLDRVALDALRAYRPLLAGDATNMNELEHRFTTMPPRAVLANSLLWTVFFLLLWALGSPIVSQRYSLDALGWATAFIAGLASFAIGSAIYLHTVHQLRLVRRTLDSVPRFNLFQLGPVYAFSRLTARTAIAWVALLTVTVISFPPELRLAVGPALWLLQGGLALAAFIVPLWSVHQRLGAEKHELLADHGRQVEVAIGRLHNRLDADDVSTTTAAKDALLALASEREFLERIPTWPWRAGTLTAVLSAVALPLVLFLVQDIVRHWLGW